MIKNNISMAVKTLKAMYDNPTKDTIDFNSPIQRKAGMWDEDRKSLLIHSVMMSSIYSVPTVYFKKEMISDKKYQYSVIDGIQRMTTIFSFIDNGFCLTNVPPVVLDGVTYDVSGKYFSDLEQDCQQEIIRFKLKIEAFEPEDGDTEEYVNDMIEDVFSRLNSAVPLTSSQLCKAKAGTSNAILINELLGSRFFSESCCYTKGQLKASDDQRCLLQGMMLLDRNYVPGFELKDFSETSIMEYAEGIKGNYTAKQSNLLHSVVQYLTEAFPEKNKQLKKINIPMLLYLADVAEDAEIKPMYFRQWFEYFTEEDTLMEVYKTFCSSGSTKLEKVNGRLAIMTKSFCQYHELEIPEELKAMVTEVEEKLASKEETVETDTLEEEVTLSEAMEEAELDTETVDVTEDADTTEPTEADSILAEDSSIEEENSLETDNSDTEETGDEELPENAEEPTSEEESPADEVTTD